MIAPPHFVFLLLAFLALATSVHGDNPLGCICGSTGNYTANNNYSDNLRIVLTNAISATYEGEGFYNSSQGQSPDVANAIALCRADVGSEDCRNCLNNCGAVIGQQCPVQKEAIIWYESCMLRFSNRFIFGTVEYLPSVGMYSPAKEITEDIDQYDEDLRNLMDGLRDEAANGNSMMKYAVGNVTVPSSRTLFGLVQCTPDLSMLQCNSCLAGAIGILFNCCYKREGARYLYPSCNVRKANQLVVTIPPIGFSLLIAGIVCIYLRSRRLKKIFETLPADEIRNVESLRYDLNTIREATNDFSDTNKLGQGGFGTVYKGTLANGHVIAVKRMSVVLGQGDQEFKNEVLLVARLQHRNLVRLLGFCLEGRERLLIYEFVPNSSLDHFIYDLVTHRQLDWERRQKIIGGIARGLLYLHEDSQLRIIHRDLKASNILLDADMAPKISDFGTARLFGVDQTRDATSRVIGTYGYMAPEYAIHGVFSVKSDVFSFGVLLLEIISGQKCSRFCNGNTMEDLLSYAWRNWREETPSNLIDANLTSGSRTEMLRCIYVGLMCVQEIEADRPTMGAVVLMLSSYSTSLPPPSRPAFVLRSTPESNITIDPKLNKSKVSRNEASITELYPR